MRSRLTGFLVIGVALAGLLGIAFVISETPVGAQIRAALVKNIDESWRTPWETRSQVLPNAGGCYSTSDCYNYSDGTTIATWDLRPVPAGKRWVVVSATGGLNGGYGRTQTIELGSPRGGLVFDGLKWAYGGPFIQGSFFNAAMFSAPVHVTFGPGETPYVRLSVPSPATLAGYTVIVFSGYLIDATN